MADGNSDHPHCHPPYLGSWALRPDLTDLALRILVIITDLCDCQEETADGETWLMPCQGRVTPLTELIQLDRARQHIRRAFRELEGHDLIRVIRYRGRGQRVWVRGPKFGAASRHRLRSLPAPPPGPTGGSVQIRTEGKGSTRYDSVPRDGRQPALPLGSGPLTIKGSELSIGEDGGRSAALPPSSSLYDRIPRPEWRTRRRLQDWLTESHEHFVAAYRHELDPGSCDYQTVYDEVRARQAEAVKNIIDRLPAGTERFHAVIRKWIAPYKGRWEPYAVWEAVMAMGRLLARGDLADKPGLYLTSVYQAKAPAGHAARHNAAKKAERIMYDQAEAAKKLQTASRSEDTQRPVQG